MPCCYVSTCKNNNRATKGSGISYHSFPSDQKLARLWKRKCYRADNFNFKSARICSSHFDADSYVRDLKSELLGINPKKLLKKDAIPTVNLPYMKIKSDSTIVQNEIRLSRMKRRNRHKLATDILTNHKNENIQIGSSSSDNIQNDQQINSPLPTLKPIEILATDQMNSRSTDISCICVEPSSNNFPQSNRQVECAMPRAEQNDASLLSLRMDYTKSRLHLLETSLKLKKSRIRQIQVEAQKLRKENSALRKKNTEILKAARKNTKLVNSSVNQGVRKILNKVFTPTQIDRLISKKRKQWTSEDITKALAIKALSWKTYFHLKNVVGIPLPGMSTLKRWNKENKHNTAIQSEPPNLIEVDAVTTGEQQLPILDTNCIHAPLVPIQRKQIQETSCEQQQPVLPIQTVTDPNLVTNCELPSILSIPLKQEILNSSCILQQILENTKSVEKWESTDHHPNIAEEQTA